MEQIKGLEKLEEEIQRLKVKTEGGKEFYYHLRKALASLEKKIEGLKEEKEILDEIIPFMVSFLKEVKKRNIEDFFKGVNSLISLFFKDFQIKIEMKENDVNLYLQELGQNFSLDLCSGGKRDLLSCILFLLFSLLAGNKIILFDESTKFLSEDKSFMFFKFLDFVSRKKGIQVIMVSHDKNVLDGAVSAFTQNIIRLDKESTTTEISSVACERK